MIAIVDYGRGNLFSVEKAVAKLGGAPVVTGDGETIRKADKVILPGVGAFGDCMKTLAEKRLVPALREVAASGRPFLGICLGLQLMFESSEESPGTEGLGIWKGKVCKIEAPGLKIPHMGWNSLSLKTKSPLLQNLPPYPYVYFVHSYQAAPEDRRIITSVAEYGGEIVASVGQGNVQATQFHPEKSSGVGLKILENFLRL